MTKLITFIISLPLSIVFGFVQWIHRVTPAKEVIRNLKWFNSKTYRIVQKQKRIQARKLKEKAKDIILDKKELQGLITLAKTRAEQSVSDTFKTKRQGFDAKKDAVVKYNFGNILMIIGGSISTSKLVEKYKVSRKQRELVASLVEEKSNELFIKSINENL